MYSFFHVLFMINFVIKNKNLKLFYQFTFSFLSGLKYVLEIKREVYKMNLYLEISIATILQTNKINKAKLKIYVCIYKYFDIIN